MTPQNYPNRNEHAARLSAADLAYLSRWLGRGGSNPGRLTRAEVDAEVAFRAEWPEVPAGAGWVRTSEREPARGEPVLGYYPGGFLGTARFWGGEYRVVSHPIGADWWVSAAEDTRPPVYWHPIPGRTQARVSRRNPAATP